MVFGHPIDVAHPGHDEPIPVVLAVHDRGDSAADADRGNAVATQV